MTPVNPAAFFAHVRTELFAGLMSQTQVDGINAILAAWPEGSDPRFVAYALVTAHWETDRTMQPIAEYGRGRGRPYGVPTGPYDQVYYGRGLVQLTWFANYRRAEAEIPGSDLVRTPDNALRPDIAGQVMVRGMTEGWFTGRKLADFFTDTRADWVHAREIINGLDHATQIGANAVKFWSAIISPGDDIKEPTP